MIKTIAQIADVHIRKTPTRNIEYQEVFNKLIADLKKKKPDRIVLVGDLVHDYLDLQGEQLILAHDLLNSLAEIAPVRITRGNHDCFTGDHEILTKNGWVKLLEYVNSDSNLEVLTFNSNNEHFEFQVPIEKIKKKFDGNLREFKSDKCEFVVTPTHELLLHQYSNNTYIKKQANSVDLNDDYRIPLRSKEIIVESDKWYELLGFCLADATFVIKNRNTMNGRVQFHFKKEKKINYLCSLLDELDIKYNVRDGDKKRNTKVVCIYSQSARDIMKYFNYNKELSYEIGLLDESKFKIKSFVDGYLNGDGSLIDNERYSCTTIFNKNAEILSTISNYVGYSGYIQDGDKYGNYENSKKQYTFFITKNNNSKTTQINKIIDTPFNGNVYCLTVSNENLFIRYKGRPFITGNCRKKNLKRVDSIQAIVKTLRNDNVEYYNKTDFYVDDNVMWAVWHHGEKNNNPWKTKEGKKILAYNEQADYVTIDLFHDPINGCRSTTDFEMKSNSYYKIKDFKGDLSFFGDIHKLQYLDDDNTKAYCGSLIAQDISEGDDAFHGYLLWDIEDKKATEIQIPNNYSYHNIRLTPYTDFDELDFEIENPTKHMIVRFIWGTLPQTRTKENERKTIDYLKGYLFKEKDNIKILHKNEFVEEDTVDVNEEITLKNISDEAVQQGIFKEYLEKIGSDDEVIADILTLDEEIFKEINVPEDQNIEWNIIKFGGNNFMSYGSLDVDWRKMDGLFQITGENTAGKTTIMKIISYILFNKTLETETRIKFGDSRFVNNRNGAKFCDAYLVLEANGEYYGLKRRTDIKTNKSGEITGAPTALSYYLLGSPDDEMNDDNDIEKLDEDRRQKTQKQIETIIGSYDNFMRIVMTTSDTLNRILSNDMAVFVDSLLYDSGLDIFDKKLEGLKAYQKRVNEKPRVHCDIETTTEQNKNLNVEIQTLLEETKNIETLKLPDVQNRIEKGREYIESLTKKLYKIEEEIYNLDVAAVKIKMGEHKKEIVEIKSRKQVLKQSIDALQETYDEDRLNELITKRDEHKQAVYEKRVQIKEEERSKSDFEHRIEILNGKIFTLKKDGAKLKEEIEVLKNSKICGQCGQVIDKQEHKDHIAKSVKDKEIQMFGIAKEIKEHQHDIDTDWKPVIKKCDENIERINTEIVEFDLEMEDVLTEIGTLTNEKNDVERRNVLQTEFNQIPVLIKNEELNIEILEQKIERHENSLKQIEENKKIEKGIDAAKKKVYELEIEESELKEDVYLKKTNIGGKQLKIKENQTLITEFKEQEHRDMVLNLYKKCVHRDGIPRQMLSNYIIPKINVTLDNILSVAAFKVWLDADDLRPKLAYNDRPEAVIDCISASGKERTFSSIVLKFGLNQINVKAKPTMFLLDEVMNKLDENAVEEFKEILQLIKSNMKKVLVIEHTHEINPDYLINVMLDENGISSMSLE